MKALLIIILSIGMISCDKDSPSATAKSETFIKMFGGAKNQYGADIQNTPDGGYILLGSSNSFSLNDMDLFLVKVDIEGNEEWSRTFGNNKVNYGNALLVTKEGDYILLGTTTDEEGFSDLLLIKVDKKGEKIWERTIGKNGFDEKGSMIKEDLDGNGYIIVGSTTELDNGKFIEESDISDALIIRTDLQGNVILNSIQGFNGPDIAHDVLPVKSISGADEYVIVGTTTIYTNGQSLNGSNVSFFKNNKNLGNNMDRNLGGDKNETGISVCNTLDGGFAIVGSTLSYGNGGEDVFLVQLKLNRDNEVTSMQNFTFGGSNDDRGVSIQQIKDGSYIILGTTYSYGNGGADIYLLKVSTTGEEIWSRTFGDEGNEKASRVINTPDGGFAIIGTLRFGNNEMMYMVKTNSEGLLFTPKI